MLVWFVFILTFGLLQARSAPVNDGESKCGYNPWIDNAKARQEHACPVTNTTKINVHIIAHSHDDVGWVRTVDEYFYGKNARGVNYIISSVVRALKQNSERKYIQVETAFFWKWWQEQSDSIKEDFRSLVNNGQIEMVNGGWVMNDEACVNYQSTIQQFTLGLRFINDTLGTCGIPRVGWQIDPFGHSREQASIFKQLGFDGAFFARLDAPDRAQRIENKKLDFLWKSSDNLNNSEIFYKVLMNHYSSPGGFCFDIACSDDPIIDDAEIFDFNADKRVQKSFEAVLEDLAKYSTTNNILLTMGDDFTYEVAEEQFGNIDKLIRLFKDHATYNLFYSTPSCYIKSVNEASPTLDVKTDDFFPYGSNEHEYWTGYFTSRPNSKRFERMANNILQASKQLRSIFKMTMVDLVSSDTDPKLTGLQNGLATMQHHDAISGTEQQHVVNDYVRLIHDGIVKSEDSLGLIIGSLLSKSQQKFEDLKFSSCLLSNVSICENSVKDRFVVAVYNPLSQIVSTNVYLPVNTDMFTITGPNNVTVNHAVLDPISDFSYVTIADSVPAKHMLVFVAEDIPPMGINLYYITVSSEKREPKNVHYEQSEGASLRFGSETLNFELDSFTNKLQSVTMNGVTMKIKQEFLYYLSANGNNSTAASGAYIFRPTNGTTKPSEITEKAYELESAVTAGEVLNEAHIKVNDWIKQVIRVYNNGKEDYIEFDWMVGPIDLNETSLEGKEIVSQFRVTGFKNSGNFYTDSNGRELIKRTRNERGDYTYDSTIEPVSSNYYPVTSRILMRDEATNLELAVLNDRSQGGTSLGDTTLELMLHRRVLADDGKGVSEVLNETEFEQGIVARGQHYLVIGKSNETQNGVSLAAKERILQLRKLVSPYVLVADATSDSLTLDAVQKSLNFQYQFLANALPDNVHILTLERWNDIEDTYLLRLEHIFEIDEDDNLSKEATVDIQSLFASHQVTSMKETTLGANEWMDDYNTRTKFLWNPTSNDNPDIFSNVEATDFQVKLSPMQIRTFVIEVAQK